MATPSTIDEYLEALPPDKRDLLASLRTDINRLAPDAEESISYGMPTWKLRGRALVYLAAWKSHLTVYPIDEAFLADHADELRGSTSTKGGLHFTTARPLPSGVLEDLVRRRRRIVEGGTG